MTVWEVSKISANEIVLVTDNLETAIEQMQSKNKTKYDYFVKKTIVQENSNERNGTERS
ncbi:MAG: hypothetical protein IKU25_09390 [Clostridia bacterium]|nr:hypothetical protein [Clostridia bacterium]